LQSFYSSSEPQETDPEKGSICPIEQANFIKYPLEGIQCPFLAHDDFLWRNLLNSFYPSILEYPGIPCHQY
jgi:hypothetical protein